MDEQVENAIVVKNLYKDFVLPHERKNSLKEWVLHFKRPTYEHFHVLHDISFEVKKGEFFGIVGRNGSGKSTLLKILSGIYQPTKGTLSINGLLTPFIELGIGFNPELTGRENVFLNGAILGLTRKEVVDLYDEIVRFAELEKFMDQKLKNYSSGMQVRLAFSIAIRSRGDILVLDEVLAVGDEAFQRKCDDYFKSQKGNRTIVLVTHNMGAVTQYCDRAMLINEGKIEEIGDSRTVARAYKKLFAPSYVVPRERRADTSTGSSKRKRCLIFADTPPPVPGYSQVIGGGLRCWGLAKGLVEQPNVEVTLAYPESYSTDTDVKLRDNYEGVLLRTWGIDDIPELVSEFDSVIVNYQNVEIATHVAQSVSEAQQLIVDCYVPVYVEISARNASNLADEYQAFINSLDGLTPALRRGDLFLCANAAQKRYYQGVLSTMGRINPLTYHEDNIMIVPYGISETAPVPKHKPVSDLLVANKIDPKAVQKILWFGGLYPWFDIKSILLAVKQLSKKLPVKLIIVGALNPLVTHPDFLSKYDEMIELIDEHKLKDTVLLHDWVAFDDRADWYLDSDIVVSYNQVGLENELSWRTRLMDYLWSDLPMITNGGDPISELLIDQHAAFRYSGDSAEEISQDLYNVLSDPKQLAAMKTNIRKLRPQFGQVTIAKPLGAAIAHLHRASDII